MAWSGCDCTWIGKLKLIVGGEVVNVELLQNDGQPFRTTGSARSRPFEAQP